MQRIIKIEKYRNIGLEKPETLVLNHSMAKGELGDLIILIGANNSGKSNVLDALRSIGQGKLKNRDITTLSFSSEDRVPSVSFCVRDKDNYMYYNVGLNKQADVQIKLEDKKETPSVLDRQMLINDMEAALDFLAKYGIGNGPLRDLLAKVRLEETEITDVLVDEVVSRINAAEATFRANYGRNNSFANIMPVDGYWRINRLVSSGSELDRANDYCLKSFGVPFLPSIVSYQENPLDSNSLQATPGNIQNSLFFRSLFRAIRVDPDEINNAYQQYESFHNPATLMKIKRKLDGKIAALNDQFNRMYFAESDGYKFSISLEGGSISFGMARGKDEDPIMLEYQSTGFRWFFNLFFNFLCSNQLKPGDIVIMDEPATNLHSQGQKELRAFIKRFARENGLTFIIATHSPFLVDTDNYDELRVISMENNRSKIDNLFTAVNYEDPDSLLPIKESLTIEQNVLYNLKTEVIWVEGITDYNYLTMFKKLLGYENIAFLPCNGIGKDDDTQQAVLKRLVSIEFHKRNLLVDGDKAGKKMKALCKDTVFSNAVCVSDLPAGQKKFVEIEDLFSDDDKKKFALAHKSAGQSSLMKATCGLDDFSQETIENFKALFALLID